MKFCKGLNYVTEITSLILAAILRHLAAGSTYADLKFSWRVPGNTLSVVFREVCSAIIDEYTDEVMTPPNVPFVAKLVNLGIIDDIYFSIHDQQLDCENPINRNLVPGACRQGPNLQDTQNVTAANIDSKREKMQRNLIKHWINSPAGSIA
ncbi:unnamed protein product [Mytilus coruscus]|uniref:Uncharacterized protein n=1 Tax=Mytilus coruscus TaxID=42192 RepID=A0A6J8CDN7_MYTCO|nr:unnamed protein product [Mytilus coruscus]